MAKKNLKQLGFKITDKFLENNNYNIYKTDESVVNVVKLIRSYAKDVLKKEWMAGNVTRIPHVVNSINPVGMFMKSEGKDDDFIALYCNSTLKTEEVKRAMYIITSSIEEFITQHKDGIEKYIGKSVEVDISIDLKLQGRIEGKFLKDNTALIKALILNAMSGKALNIGMQEDDNYITPSINVKLYPCYSKSDGHYLITDILEHKDYKYAIYISPQIEVIDGDIYLFPNIGVKRFIRGIETKEAITYSKADSNTILIYDGEHYHTPRIRFDRKSQEIKMVSDDWKLFKFLEDKGITYEEIKNYVEGQEESDNIFVQYHPKLGRKSKIGSGLPSQDKIDIFNYISNIIPELEPIKELEEISYRNKAGAINNSNKLILANTIYRNNINNINLHIIHDGENEIFDTVADMIENGIFAGNKGLEILEKGNYRLLLGDGKEVLLKLLNTQVKDTLSPKKDDEEIEDRIFNIKKEINFTGDLNIALIELEKRNDNTDAKSILRDSMDKIGIINQFIEKKEEEKSHRVRAAILDLLNDIGFGNANQVIKKNQVIYTMHKIKDINIIARLDNESIEVYIPSVIEKFIHITNTYRYLSEVSLLKSNNNELSLDTFINLLNNEKREKIVILEQGEVKRNSILTSMDLEFIEKIKRNSDIYVTTDLLNREFIQILEGDISLGKGVYKHHNNVYISVGEKVQGNNSTVIASKVRAWTNTKGGISIGATTEYKNRIAFEIRVNRDDFDTVKLIHNLRLNVTTYKHLNRTIITDYITGLDKHI